jgi:hypothetical protein
MYVCTVMYVCMNADCVLNIFLVYTADRMFQSLSPVMSLHLLQQQTMLSGVKDEKQCHTQNYYQLGWRLRFDTKICKGRKNRREELNNSLEYNDVTDTEVYHSWKLHISNIFTILFVTLKRQSIRRSELSETLLCLTAPGICWNFIWTTLQLAFNCFFSYTRSSEEYLM